MRRICVLFVFIFTLSAGIRSDYSEEIRQNAKIEISVFQKERGVRYFGPSVGAAYSYQLSLCFGKEKHPEHREFIGAVRRFLGNEIDADFLDSVFEDPRICYAPETLTAKMTWAEFSARVNTRESAEDSVKFFLKHEKFFRRAAADYGVSPFVILSIIKVETDLGKNLKESPPVPLALYNLYFLRKDRTKVLERTRIFLNMTLDLGWDPFVGGSREAAIGLPQFMLANESLYYSADGDCDGKVDLYKPADAIESVGKYLSLHGYGKRPIENVLWSYNHSRPYVGIVLRHDALVRSVAK